MVRCNALSRPIVRSRAKIRMRHAIGLSMAHDRILIESVGIRAVEVSSGRNQSVADEPSRRRTHAKLDARCVDSFFLNEILPGVECALCACLRMLVCRRVTDHDEF